ncbi:MAG: GDP-mannose 4,6-dehydratase [Bacteroidetes bacterium]|nr:GDP-mannose 4,6-dehydratase [Bacteroidota bacterium]
MKYLITGGAGFIGSHLADELVSRGHDVCLLDDLSTGSIQNISHLLKSDQVRFVEGNIMNFGLMEDLISECDEIFHLAAVVGVHLILEKPVHTITTNVEGTQNVLKLAAKYGRKVLVASTSEVYGKVMETQVHVDRLKEDGDWTLGATGKSRWSYACSKAMDEFLALAYYEEAGLPVVIARFFNTVGPRQTGRYGMVIPNFIGEALSNKPIRVFGDGRQTRCFTAVSDAVRASIDLMNTPEAIGQVFNIGSSHEISINDLASRIKTLSGSTSAIVHVPYEIAYAKGYEDMRRRTPDISKLKETIGYHPTYSIDDIICEILHHREAHRFPKLQWRKEGAAAAS